MGWNSAVQVTPVVIVGGPSGSGIFIYNGTPSFGNLIESHTPITATGTTDSFGNGIVGGDTVYSSSGGSFYAFQRTGVTVASVWTALTVAGPYTTISAWGRIVIQPIAQAIIMTGTVAINSGPFNSTGGTAVNPSILTTDSWNTMTLLGAWTTTGGYAQYMLNADNTVSARGLITAGTLTNGTTIWDAPSGYIPAGAPGTQLIDVAITGGTGTVGFLTPRIGINAAGVMFIENIPTGTTQIAFNGRYSLT